VKPKVEAPTSGGVQTVSSAEGISKTSVNAEGRETYATTPSESQKSSTFTVMTPSLKPEPPLPVQDDEDDTSVPVAPGTPCKRRGCGVTFISEEESRIGEGEGTICNYHPSPVSVTVSTMGWSHTNTMQPIFREGSKVCIYFIVSSDTLLCNIQPSTLGILMLQAAGTRIRRISEIERLQNGKAPVCVEAVQKRKHSCSRVSLP
jgi:hypothetical protein